MQEYLGLRLIKKTINFDIPEVYHLYFGNETGEPGTIITFFPWGKQRERTNWDWAGRCDKLHDSDRFIVILGKTIWKNLM